MKARVLKATGWQNKLPRLRWLPPPLYFIHIPKTAGTALENFLLQVYGQQAFRFVPLRGLSTLDPRQLRAYRCWRSHSGPGLIAFLPQAGLQCISVVRDPVEQMVSYIYHMRRLLVERPSWFDTTYYQTMQPLMQADLRTWLAHPNSAYFDNFQTRHLGATWNLAPWFKTGEYGGKKINTRFPWEPLPLSVTNDMAQVLAQACRQIDQLAVIGITEHFAQSLELIAALLGAPMPTQIPKANIGLNKVDIQTDFYRRQLPPDLCAVIEARNQYDRELYAYACRQFATQQAARQRTISIALPLGKSLGSVNLLAKQVKRKLRLALA
jgi:hypothetical protein